MQDRRSYGPVRWALAIVALFVAVGIWGLRTHPEVAESVGLGKLAPSGAAAELQGNAWFRCGLTWARTPPDSDSIRYRLHCLAHKRLRLQGLTVSTITPDEHLLEPALAGGVQGLLHGRQRPLGGEAVALAPGQSREITGTLPARPKQLVLPKLVVTARLAYPDEGLGPDAQRADEGRYYRKYNLLLIKDVY